MGLSQAKTAYATFKTEIEGVKNASKRLDYLDLVKKEVIDMGKLAEQEIRDTPPDNLSDLGEYRVVDAAGNVYDVDEATGDLTKI